MNGNRLLMRPSIRGGKTAGVLPAGSSAAGSRAAGVSTSGSRNAGLFSAGSRITGSLTVALLAAALLTWGLAGCDGGAPPDRELSYAEEIEAWHTERIAALKRPDGWLSLIGLHPLEVGAQRIGSSLRADIRLPETAPLEVGIFVVGPERITFAAHPRGGVVECLLAEEGTEQSRPVKGMPIKTDAAGDPTILGAGSLRFYVIERGFDRFVRIKDLDHPRIVAFEGIERFPVTETWRVEARLIEHPEHDTIAITNALGQTERSPSPGRLAFELSGTAYTLTPLGEAGEDLFIVFGDATNGAETYGGGRFLSTAAPDSNGIVLLDFNRAINPPGVFSPHATCPLPPPENVLALPVTAGEKMWGAGH